MGADINELSLLRNVSVRLSSRSACAEELNRFDPQAAPDNQGQSKNIGSSLKSCHPL